MIDGLPRRKGCMPPRGMQWRLTYGRGYHTVAVVGKRQGDGERPTMDEQGLQDMLDRLARIEGQVRGVSQMRRPSAIG